MYLSWEPTPCAKWAFTKVLGILLCYVQVIWNFSSHELLTLSHDPTTFCSTQSSHIQGFVVTDWFVVCLVKSTSLGDLHCISQCIQNRGRITTRNIWQRIKNTLSTPRLALQYSLCLWCMCRSLLWCSLHTCSQSNVHSLVQPSPSIKNTTA